MRPTTVGFSHWILFDLSPELRSLPAGAGAPGQGTPGSVLGFTDYGGSAYGGMAHPRVTRRSVPVHRVRARRAAARGCHATTTYAKFRFLIRGHVLAQGTLTGLFGRKG